MVYTLWETRGSAYPSPIYIFASHASLSCKIIKGWGIQPLVSLVFENATWNAGMLQRSRDRSALAIIGNLLYISVNTLATNPGAGMQAHLVVHTKVASELANQKQAVVSHERVASCNAEVCACATFSLFVARGSTGGGQGREYGQVLRGSVRTRAARFRLSVGNKLKACTV